MDYRDYDQQIVGKYLNEYTSSSCTLDERFGQVKRAIRKSLVLELGMGAVALAFEYLTRHSDTLAPIYYAMLWGAVIGVTMLRLFFAGKSLSEKSVGALSKAQGYGKLKQEMVAQVLIVLAFIVNMSVYEGHAWYGIRILLIGCSIAAICYAFSYMSYNLDNLKWWEFRTPYIKRCDD